jgi:hypothetical protein
VRAYPDQALQRADKREEQPVDGPHEVVPLRAKLVRRRHVPARELGKAGLQTDTDGGDRGLWGEHEREKGKEGGYERTRGTVLTLKLSSSSSRMRISLLRMSTNLERRNSRATRLIMELRM